MSFTTTAAERLELMDTQRFDISKRGSYLPETQTVKTCAQDPLDTDSISSPSSGDSESFRSSLLNAQRYDYSKRPNSSSSSSRGSPFSASIDISSPEPCPKEDDDSAPASLPLDPEAVIERLYLEVERLRIFDAQRYDPRSRTNSPEPSITDRHPIMNESNFLGPGNESTSIHTSCPSGDFPTANEHETHSVSDTMSSRSIQFADIVPRGRGRSLASAHQPPFVTTWNSGRMVTTHTILHPNPRKPGSDASRSSRTTTPSSTFSSRALSPFSRASSPSLRSARAMMRSLNCVSPVKGERDSSIISRTATEASQNISAANGPMANSADEAEANTNTTKSEGQGLTVFVSQPVDDHPLSDEEREREQLWREAMCSLHFGGDWEQMNKRFPPGQPRW
ncbi:hypothetical protein D9757_006862 [Collybiopsis confluens]|uniref:Uncharacterized protein n=1 Tax=Collybiopsis confluens TaxID=2823264 RepID=A0A8H5HPP3_9AGAR|nr:hypothetical protein D9757_006862 [Collybiopsis confluens]